MIGIMLLERLIKYVFREVINSVWDLYYFCLFIVTWTLYCKWVCMLDVLYHAVKVSLDLSVTKLHVSTYSIKNPYIEWINFCETYTCLLLAWWIMLEYQIFMSMCNKIMLTSNLFSLTSNINVTYNIHCN